MDGRQRNRSNRNSGIFEQNGQSFQRRVSRKTPHPEGQGQTYPDGFGESSIRAVNSETPSRRGQNSSAGGESLYYAVSTPSPPATAIEGYVTAKAAPIPNGGREIGNSYKSKSPLGSVPRPRTRTLEERIRDRSPSNVLSKTRSRVGSLQSRGDSKQQEPHDPMNSIGFPSISPPMPTESQPRGQRLVKAPPRPLSPIPMFYATDHSSAPGSPTTDTGKILQLMKITCGRMHGILSFRTNKASAWSNGYCAINVGSGSLIYQLPGDVSRAKTLIPDLRGCKVRTQFDRETQVTFLDVSTATLGLGIHLRPHVPETFDSWLAALLCWQPIRPKGVQNKMTKPQAAAIPERRFPEKRRNSIINVTKDAAIIKVGKMLCWDHGVRPNPSRTSNRRFSTYKQLRSSPGPPWQKVSCTLQENGIFKLFTESDTSLMSTVPLSSLSRYAIQRLDPSVLDDEFCIAIYPQYTALDTLVPCPKPIYLSMESRVLLEVWFVLLRAFTIPELYGPEKSPELPELGLAKPGTEGQPIANGDMFRVEKLVSMRIIEAKTHSPQKIAEPHSQKPGHTGSSHGHDWIAGDYHTEVLFDGEVRARTALKHDTSNPFWREDYEFVDLPAVLSSASVVLKSRNLEQKDWTLISRGPYDYDQTDINNLGNVGDIDIRPLDAVYGMVELRLDELDRGKDIEKWWPVCNEQDELVGELLMKLRVEEVVVLMSQDYRELSELLHTFSNGLTQQIGLVASNELRKLPETLLNIFQVSGQASHWLMSLVEDEIDGVHRDTPVSRFRYSRRIASNDSYDSGVEREMLLRDLGKSATAEANLLFRGNSLLTKALDLHMRRLGKEYLEETLSETIRDIDESNPDCEVDPNRVQQSEDLQRNWRNLIALTENLWKAIYSSANRCPPELRMIFRHIRACADDRFGDFLRTVTYSSVSGFLFLRFFCPAVLNPKLFGLLKDHPRTRAQRTLTLIAKSLQTLANLNTFGNKEPWMEPMNAFLTGHRQEFKVFVDNVCAISSDRTTSTIPPSYATPITILSRLPATSREGFPSLPYLLDQAREFAALIGLWVEAEATTSSSQSAASEEVKHFAALCNRIRARTIKCLNQAEQAGRPSGELAFKWEELIEQMDRRARAPEADSETSTLTGIAATYMNNPISRTSFNSTNSTRQRRRWLAEDTPPTDTDNENDISLHDQSTGYFDVNARPRGGRPTAGIYAANAEITRSSSEVSGFDSTPPGSSSGVWDPGTGGGREGRFPSHALHWGESSNNNSTYGIVGAGVSSVEDESVGRGKERKGSLANNLASLEVEPRSGGATPRSGPTTPAAPRGDGGRRLADVWGFRRREGGKKG